MPIRMLLTSNGSHNSAPSPPLLHGLMWLVMTGSPTICASKIGMPNPSRVEAKSKKSLVAYASCISSVGELGLRGVFNSQLLQHAMICVRGLSNDAKMNIQTLQRFGMTAQVFVLGNSDVQGDGFGVVRFSIPWFEMLRYDGGNDRDFLRVEPRSLFQNASLVASETVIS